MVAFASSIKLNSVLSAFGVSLEKIRGNNGKIFLH